MAKSKTRRSGININDYKMFFLAGGAIVLLDQATKYIVAQSLPLNTGKIVIPGFFNLVHVLNTGGAFSLFAGTGSEWRPRIFILLALIVVGIITYAFGMTPKSDRWNRGAYIFIAGGAVGNLIDRVRTGEVIDFLDFYVSSWHWPAFNVADMAISTGAVMLLVSLVRGR